MFAKYLFLIFLGAVVILPTGMQAGQLKGATSFRAEPRDDHDRDDQNRHVKVRRYYDRDHRDYHDWDDRENRAYRYYLQERNRTYHDFAKMRRREQQEYWRWRHEHPGNDWDRH